MFKAVGFTPIPERIARLVEIAYNLWWTWHPEAQPRTPGDHPTQQESRASGFGLVLSSGFVGNKKA